MHKSLAIFSRSGISSLIIFIIAGCTAISSPTSLPPTHTPVPLPSETPTSCMGGWTWAYGTVTPAFLTQLQDDMTASGLEGSVQASTFGENDGCGGYHAMSVDYMFTVQVPDLEASGDLASKAAAVLGIAQRFVDASPAPNLGKLQLTFQRGSQQCSWAYESGAWNLLSRKGVSGSACQVPVTAETEQLAKVLTGLAADLGCETSGVIADTQRAVLECERPQRDATYVAYVTIRVSGDGYEGICFHGYHAFESSMTGDNPMSVTENGQTHYERDRSFQWSANGLVIEIRERIMGGPNVKLPAEIREQVHQRLVRAGVISGEGKDCQ